MDIINIEPFSFGLGIGLGIVCSFVSGSLLYLMAKNRELKQKVGKK